MVFDRQETCAVVQVTGAYVFWAAHDGAQSHILDKLEFLNVNFSCIDNAKTTVLKNRDNQRLIQVRENVWVLLLDLLG